VFSENVIPEVITNVRLDYSYTKGQGIRDVRHPDAKMVRTRDWKYNYYVGNGEELYDLREDPEEMRNLAGDPRHADLVCELRREILDWMITADESDQIAPRWLI
jgi:arylsulfatase A-like enzyme